MSTRKSGFKVVNEDSEAGVTDSEQSNSITLGREENVIYMGGMMEPTDEE